MSGLAAERRWLVDAPAWWHKVTVEVLNRVGVRPVTDHIGDDSASFPARGIGNVTLWRDARRVLIETKGDPNPDALVHPLFAPIAMTFARWWGQEAFHAGAFVHRGHAWLVAGDRGAGKSTLLASMALQGVDVLADDLVVTRGSVACAGPRCVDLRSDAAEALGVGDFIGTVGGRERWRYPLRSVPAEAPLGGWLVLSRGELRPRRLRPSEALQSIVPHRAIRAYPPDPAELLRLAALPAVVAGPPDRLYGVGGWINDLLVHLTGLST